MLYLINYILFICLVNQITYKKYSQLSRMSKLMEGCVAFPTTIFVCGTVFFS